MGSALSRNLSGFLIPEATWTYADRDTTLITATEANPRPGSFVSDDARSMLVPAIRGGQDTAADLYVSKSGNPGVSSSACNVIYKTGSATLWRGYNQPHVAVDWQPMAASTAAGLEFVAATRIPSTGVIVAVVTLESGAVGSNAKACVWTPSTGVWTSANIISNATGSSYQFGPVACVTLPDERVVAFLKVDDAGGYFAAYSSDDAGATWALYSADIGVADYAPASLATSMSAAMSGADICLMIWEDEGASNSLLQYASSDLGATFTLVRTWTEADATYPNRPHLATMPDGRIALAYRTIAGDVGVRVVGSAWEAFEDATEVVVNVTGTANTIGFCCDEEGTLLLYVSAFTLMSLFTSTDGGVTWSAARQVTNTTSASDYVDEMVAIATMGRVFLLHSFVASTGTQDTLPGALVLGGWSEWEQPATSTTDRTLCIIPYELPYDLGTYWTRTGVGGAWALNTDGYITLTTFGIGLPDYVVHDYGAANQDLMAVGRVRVTAGGAVASNNAIVKLQSGDGTDLYRTSLRFSFADGQFRWTKGSTETTIATINWDWTKDLIFMLLLTFDPEDYALGTETVTAHLYYRATNEENWTKASASPESVAVSASAANSLIEVGARADTVATTCRWIFLDTWVDDPGVLYPNTAKTTMVGKPIGIYGFPLPTIGPDSQIARLSLDAGPGIVGDGFDIDPVADRPLSNLYHDSNPSPSAPWRSTDTTEQVVMAWSPGSAGIWRGWGVAVFNSNADLVTLEGWDGAAWQYIAQANPRALADVAYARTGDMVIPNSTGDSGDRLFFRNELAGGFVNLGGGKYRKIRRNTGGVWKTGNDASVAKMEIYLDGIDGTEGATGVMTVYAPNSVGVELVASEVAYTKFQVKVEAVTNADGYFQIGQIIAGPVVFNGKQHSYGWQWQRALNAETTRSRNGASLTRRLGSAPRSLTISWPEGVDMYRARSADPHYIEATAGTAMAPDDGVAFSLSGLVEELKSGEIPVVVLPLIGGSGLSATDPSRFLYGRITSDIGLDHVLGEEGSGEVYRIAGVTVEEIV